MSDLIATASPVETLPTLIDRAATALEGARTSAEVLEARDFARVAYDAARSAGRMAKAKEAHDEVIGAVYRAQADAALIEARAKMRLADEYDAAQERGEIAGHGGDKVSNVAKSNVATTAADLGLRRDEIHEARKLRDAEKTDPGKAERVVKDMLAKGEEPTKAKLRRAMVGDDKATDQPEDDEIDRKLRRAFRKMTVQAQEDDWVGIKRALHDEKVKIRQLRAEIQKLKDQLKTYTHEDKNSVIRALNKTIEHKNSEMYRANEKADAAMRQVHVLKKRVAELEQMGIAL